MAGKKKKIKKMKRVKRKKDTKKKNRAKKRSERGRFVRSKPGKNKKKKNNKNDKEFFSRTKIRIFGIGGGAGSVISEIALRVKKADFIAANTDSKALRTIGKKVKKFQFGQNLTSGLGTGMNVELGEAAAQEEKERIKKLFEGQDLCVIISCLGGGTGAGASSIFAKISKASGCLTYGIFTLPFEFEGEKKMEIAREALEKIRPHLSVFSVIPNERIFQIIDKDTPLKEALSAINQKLVQNLEGLIEMIYSPGLINIDFADLKTILAGKGRLAYLNAIEIAETNKEEAVKKVISSPLYPYTLKGARGILYNIVGGRNLQLSDVSKISGIVSEFVNKNAKIIFGIGQQKKYENKVKITLLATGCSSKGGLLKKKEPLKKKKQKKALSVETKKPELENKTKTKTKSKSRPNFKSRAPSDLKKKPRAFKSKKRIKIKSKTKLRTKKRLEEKKESKNNYKLKIETEPKAKLKLKAKTKVKTSVESKEKSRPKLSLAQKTSLSLGQKTSPRPGLKSEPKKELKPEQKPKSSPDLQSPKKEEEKTGPKVRRNALQLKKVMEDEEKELMEKENIWETPAIFRRKNDGN